MSEKLHPFEEAGLGQAPFVFVGITKNVYSAAPGHIQPGGCCSYCSQGIMWECQIQSHDGKRFAVGLDCVRKLERVDNVLVNAMKRESLRLDRIAREAARKARYEAGRQRMESELDRQRQVNGGLTDSEVAERDRKAAEEAARSVWIERNRWLILILQGQDGEFCRSICDSLERGPVSGLSPRAITILKDIYGKAHGRRGSKKYDAAVDEFETRSET